MTWIPVTWIPLLAGIGIGLCVAGNAGCSKRKDSTRLEPTLVIPEAPSGLVATLVIKHPQASWQAVIAEAENSALLPRSLSMLLASALGLPGTVAEDLDLEGPAYAAAATQPGERLGVAFAFHARRTSALSEWLGRRRADAQPQSPFALGLSDDYLVVASDTETLDRVGSYASRGLPARGQARHDFAFAVPRAAIAGPVVRSLRRAWEDWKTDRQADDRAMRAQHGGSTPDFGDPTGALADMEGKATRLFAVIGDLSELRVDLDIDGESHAARATVLLRPAAATGPAAEEIAGMDTGDGEPALALPRSAALALLWRESAVVRKQSADQQMEGIARVLGERLGEADRKKLGAALNAWAEGRGDWLTAGVVWSDRAQAALLRSATVDRDTMDHVPERFLGLLSIPAIREPLAAWFGDLRAGPVTSDAERDGVSLRAVHVLRQPRAASALRKTNGPIPAPDPIDIVWASGKETFAAAAGPKAKAALVALQPGSGEPTLADDPRLAKAVRRFGPKITFLAVADANRLGPQGKGAENASPLVIAYGKTQTEPSAQARAWLEVEVPTALLIGILTRWTIPRVAGQ